MIVSIFVVVILTFPSFLLPQLRINVSRFFYLPLGDKLITLAVERIGVVDDLGDYKDIFVKVKNWSFERSDIERNEIWSAEEERIIMPDFVERFEEELVRKPRLHPDVRCFFVLSVRGSTLRSV